MPEAQNASSSSTSDDAKGSTAGESDDNNNQDIDYYRGELSEAIKRRDNAAKRAREQENRAKALEAELDELKNKSAVKGGKAEDVDKEWRTKYEKDLGELKTELDAWKGRYRKGVTLNKFASVAADKVYNLEQVLTLVMDKLDVEVEDDGSERLIWKQGNISRSDVDKCLEEFLERNPNLARNPGRAGSGAQGNKGAPGGVQTYADLQRLSAADRAKWIRDNPKEAAAIYSKVRIA